MVKVFVIYDSKYGNTKLVAEKIAEGMHQVEGTEISIGYVKEIEPEKLIGYDAILIGAPNHMGKPSWTIRKFIDKLTSLDLKVKSAAVFDTYLGRQRNFEKAMKKMEKTISEKLPNLKLLTPGLSIKVTGIKGPFADGEIAKCIEFGKKIANQIKA